MKITVDDYNEDYYLRRGNPYFDVNGPIPRLAARKVKFFADLIRGKRILDMGCGRGEQSRWCAEHGAKEVVGVDWSPDAVKIAKYYCRNSKNVAILRADARTYKHDRKHYFDVVLMLDFIEHLTRLDAQKVYKQCWWNWSKPDGWLCVISPPKNKCVFHLYHQSERSLRHDIRAAGFRVKKLEKHKLAEPVFVVRAQRLRNP